MPTFDERPLNWLLVAIMLLTGWLVSAFFSFRKKNDAPVSYAAGSAFVVTGLLWFGWMRLPAMLFNHELNADESQVLAHALTLWQYPTYWQAVDANTIGPLNLYVLWGPHLLGMPFDYRLAHLLGTFCLAATWLLFYGTARRCFGPQAGTAAGMALLLVWGLSTSPDFVHYSSEQLPQLLLMAAVALLARRPAAWPYLLAGVLLGLVPYGKLQGVPLAAVAGTYGLWTARHRPKALTGLVMGALLPTALLLLWLSAKNLLDDFRAFYIEGNLIYAQGSGLWHSLRQLPGMLSEVPALAALLAWAAAQSLFSFFSGKRPDILWLWLALAAALYSVLKTGHTFVHYLHWLVLPAAGLLGAGLAGRPVGRIRALLAAGSMAMLLPFVLEISTSAAYNRYPSGPGGFNRALSVSPAAARIAALSQPGQRLSVWGWADRLYVESQRPQGTAESHTERCIYPHPMQRQYYQRYLSDLARNRPAVFADAVGPRSLWVQDTLRQNYGSFPELKAYVDKHYTFVGQTDGIRLFRRKSP